MRYVLIFKQLLEKEKKGKLEFDIKYFSTFLPYCKLNKISITLEVASKFSMDPYNTNKSIPSAINNSFRTQWIY